MHRYVQTYQYSFIYEKEALDALLKICGTSRDKSMILLFKMICQGTTQGPYRKGFLIWAKCTKCPAVRGQLMLLLGCSDHNPMIDSDSTVSITSMCSTCASSCGEPDGLSGRMRAHRGGTERVDVQCVF